MLVVAHHFHGIGDFPGFHFDEGWAARYSHRIAFEPGFWPLTAMSPHTSPWSHYWTALLFKFFGSSVEVFRASSVILSLASLFLIGLLLILRVSFFSGLAFLAMTATAPVLLHNHRFAIEINSFLPLCFAVLLWGLALWSQRGAERLAYGLILGSLVFGVTSHVLFLGVPLALLLNVVWVQERIDARQRQLIESTSLLLIPFFIRGLIGSIWPLKSVALIVASLGVFAWSRFFSARVPALIKKHKGTLSTVLIALGLVFFFNFVIFLEGSWTALFAYGSLEQPYLVGTYLIGPVAIWIAVFIGKKSFSDPRSLAALRFFFFLNLAMGLIMIRPSPRYFEISFLFFFLLLALLLQHLPRKVAGALVLLACGLGLLNIRQNYLLTGEKGRYVQRDFSLGLLTENSMDMMPKTRAVDYVRDQGCRMDRDARIKDERLGLILRDLEWVRVGPPSPNAAPCALGSFEVIRKAHYRGSAENVLADLDPLLILK